MKSSVGMKIGAGFALALLILIVVGAVSYASIDKLTKTNDLVTHTYRVITNLNGILQAMTDAETGQRGYLLTAKEGYLKPYQDGSSVVEGFVEEVRRLTSDNPKQQSAIKELDTVCQKRLVALKE